jgi:hypothetical protein
MVTVRALHRRLEKLEAVLNVLSTDDKWAIVQERALQLISNQSAIASFEDALWMAMGEGTVRFTIPEMDQLLAEA